MSVEINPRLELEPLATGLDHPEGICWDPDRQCLWAGGEAGQIYRITLDGAWEIVVTIEGAAILGVALDAAGRLYACDWRGHQVWRVDGAGVEPFGGAIDYPNYAAFASDGTLFVTDSGSFEEATGRLWAIHPSGATDDVTPRPLRYANGLAVQDNMLWIVESALPGVSAYDLATGTLDKRIFLERCQPDGLAVDAAGGLLISCYQPNQLWRYEPDAGLELLLDDWTGEYALTPTNIAFYGDQLDRLALASLGGTAVTTLRPPHPGLTPLRP